MKVTAFNTSPRAGGNTHRMLEIALEALAKEGIDTELVEAGAPLAGCRACYACKKMMNGRCVVTSDAMNDHIAKMVQSDGILIGTPVYFADACANARALVERAGLVTRINGNQLRRKVGAGVVCARRGGFTSAFDSLNKFFLIGEMIVPGSIYWNMGQARDIGELDKDTEGVETMRVLGTNMAWLLKKLHA
jgi:multimeric flavodoxin WrbA